MKKEALQRRGLWDWLLTPFSLVIFIIVIPILWVTHYPCPSRDWEKQKKRAQQIRRRLRQEGFDPDDEGLWWPDPDKRRLNKTYQAWVRIEQELQKQEE